MESFFAVTKSLILRALVIYFISSFFRSPATKTEQKSMAPGGANIANPAAWNLFPNGTYFDMHVYVSDDYDSVDFEDPNSLIWFKDDLIYGDWYSGENNDGVFTKSIKITASESLKANGSIYLHTYVTKSGHSPNPKDKDFAGRQMGYTRRLLNKFKKIKYTKTHNLITGGTAKSEEEIQKSEIMSSEIVSHWHSNLTINFVTDQTNWVKGSVPSPLDEFIHFLPGGITYLPIIYYNDYWNMLRDYQPINETTTTLDLYLTYQPLSLFKWQLYAAQNMRGKFLKNNILGDVLVSEQQDEEEDSLKETLLETNPYLLGATIIVSILHSVFELLAFKNDIQFWNNRKSLEGLSVRSVFFGVFQSVIVLLYVLDNETNIMIKISCFVGLGIEVWKIHKVVNVNINKEDRIFGILPKITFADKGSYAETATREYDNLAFKYLGWLCFPLLFGYGIYSLIYQEHKGYYSYVLNILYGFLLTFGFVMMTPQLFINYKLKSVAHLPWRMMTYKFLNTFIDDIFAFVIKMPTMYRLGCFRDGEFNLLRSFSKHLFNLLFVPDIVFLVFLYQRWIYKVDIKRVNEFGFSGEMLEESTKSKAEKDGVIKAIADTPPKKEISVEKPLAEKKDD